jgi:hypothetical protein
MRPPRSRTTPRAFKPKRRAESCINRGIGHGRRDVGALVGSYGLRPKLLPIMVVNMREPGTAHEGSVWMATAYSFQKHKLPRVCVVIVDQPQDAAAHRA